MAYEQPSPFMPPRTEEPPPEPVVSEEELAEANRKRLRLAGILLLVNAAIVLSERVVTMASTSSADSPTGGLLPAVIDVLIASSFLKNNDKYRTLAIVRIVLGFLVGGGLSIARSDYGAAVGMALGFAGLLLVLVGPPARGRNIAGTILFGLLAALEIVGLFFVGGAAGQ